MELLLMIGTSNTKIKTLFFFMTLIVFSLPTHAAWYTHSDWPESWLIGVSGGYGVRQGSLNVQLDYAGLPFMQTTNVVRSISDPGFIFGLFAGYQATCQDWLLGIEADIEWHDLEREHDFAFSDSSRLVGWNGSAHYKSPVMYGISGRMGYAFVGYFMPYVRLGAEVGRDELETVFFSNSAIFPFSLTLQDKKWIYRFLIGAGIEFPLPCLPLTVRLEYDLHSKGKTIETNNSYFDRVLNPNFNSDLQPQTKSVIASLVWNIF